MADIDILVAVRREKAGRYHKALSGHAHLRLQITSHAQDVLETLADAQKHTDVVVLDSGLGPTFELIQDIRHWYPRVFVVVVDESGQASAADLADEVSQTPFENNDLARRITRLMSDRHLETVRMDTSQAVRNFAKGLRNAISDAQRLDLALQACRDLGYEYVAIYRPVSYDNQSALALEAHRGPTPLQAISPQSSSSGDVMSWAFQQGKSRIINAADNINHPLVAKGRMGVAAAVPVIFAANRYGVLLVFRDQANSITQDDLMTLEFMAAQLASTIAKDLVK
jgi:GAF domain-containing protein